MLEPPDQVLHFSSTDLCGGELEGSLTGKRGMGSRKPGAHLLEVAFKELKCEADQPGEPDKSIGLLRLESFGVLAPGQGPRRDLEELRGTGRRKVENPTKSFERFVGEPLSNSQVKLSGFVRSKAKERNVGVSSLRIGVDLAPEPVDGLGSGSRSDAHDESFLGHMA